MVTTEMIHATVVCSAIYVVWFHLGTNLVKVEKYVVNDLTLVLSLLPPTVAPLT